MDININNILSNINMSSDLLLSALDNSNNDYILKETTRSIKDKTNNILERLPVSIDTIKKYKNVLNNYRYCDEIDDIHLGKYLRWVVLDKDDYKLHNGGFLMDVTEQNDLIYLLCKKGKYIFKIHYSTNLVFQKLTSQEIILLKTIDYLNS